MLRLPRSERKNRDLTDQPLYLFLISLSTVVGVFLPMSEANGANSRTMLRLPRSERKIRDLANQPLYLFLMLMSTGLGVFLAMSEVNGANFRTRAWKNFVKPSLFTEKHFSVAFPVDHVIGVDGRRCLLCHLARCQCCTASGRVCNYTRQCE